MQKKIRITLNNSERIKKFAEIVGNFVSDIDLITDMACIDAKSILGLYAIDLSQNTYVQIISDNVDECRKFDAAMEEFR